MAAVRRGQGQAGHAWPWDVWRVMLVTSCGCDGLREDGKECEGEGMP